MKLFAVLTAATFLCVFVDKASLAEDWSQWRGPNRDSQLSDATWPSSLGEKLTTVWEKPHSPSYSGPVIHDGLLYTTETIDKKSEKVTAYVLETGDVAWTKEWPGAMAVPFFAAANGDWIRSTPTVTSDALVILGMRDVLVSLDPKTGDEQWRVDFPKTMGTPMPSFGAVCSPIIDEGAVYVQTGGELVKLNLSDGSLIWQTLANGEGMMSSGAFSSPTIATIAGQRQLVVQTRQELCGVDLETGNVLWKQPIEAFRGMNILTPLVIGDRVFTSAHSGKAQLFEIKNSGEEWNVEEVWVQKSQAYMSSPVLMGDAIYIHLKNQRVASINLADGEIKWTSSPFGKYWSMVSNGEKILALDSSGDLMLIAPDESKLNIIDQKKVATDSWAHLAVQGDYVVVRDLAALKVFRWK